MERDRRQKEEPRDRSQSESSLLCGAWKFSWPPEALTLSSSPLWLLSLTANLQLSHTLKSKHWCIVIHCLSKKKRESLNSGEQLDKVKDLSYSLSYIRHHATHWPSHGCFSLKSAVPHRLACLFILQSSGLSCPHPWTFCPLWNKCLRIHEKKLGAALGQSIVYSLRLKLTITRRHACLESNYSYYRGNPTAVPWLEKIAWIAPVAKPLTSRETKHTHKNTNVLYVSWVVQPSVGHIRMLSLRDTLKWVFPEDLSEAGHTELHGREFG